MPAVRSRISWGAIIAGVVVAIILQVAMNMLGLAIGAAALDPGDPNALAPGFGTATVLWMAASILISLFTGGAVAGYMSGRIGRNEGLWHGLTVWAVTTILALWMLTSAAGSVINGVTNALGQGLGLLGASAAEIVPEVADTAVLQDTLLTSIRDEAGAMSGPTTSEASTDTGTGTTTGTTTTDGTDTTAAAQQPRAMNASMVLGVGELLAAEEGSP
jgi:MFS family permease